MQQARACHAAGQVADFGCAHLAPAPGVVARQLRRGTLAYQPPELLDGGIGTPAADCYAFGALLWEMLTAQARPGFHTVWLQVSALFYNPTASHMRILGTCSAGCMRACLKGKSCTAD